MTLHCLVKLFFWVSDFKVERLILDLVRGRILVAECIIHQTYNGKRVACLLLQYTEGWVDGCFVRSECGLRVPAQVAKGSSTTKLLGTE